MSKENLKANASVKSQHFLELDIDPKMVEKFSAIVRSSNVDYARRQILERIRVPWAIASLEKNGLTHWNEPFALLFNIDFETHIGTSFREIISDDNIEDWDISRVEGTDYLTIIKR